MFTNRIVNVIFLLETQTEKDNETERRCKMNISIESVENGFLATEYDVFRDEGLRHPHKNARSVCLTPGELFAWLYKRLPNVNVSSRSDRVQKLIDDLFAMERKETP